MKPPRPRDPIPPGCPLIETHLHLEGSIPHRVLRRLASKAGRPLPATGPERPLQRRRGFPPFLDAFVGCASLLRSREDVRAAALALFEDLRTEGVAWAEITVSPQVHLRRGLPFTEIAAGLGEARDGARRAGGPEAAFIVDGGRLWGAGWFEEIVEQAAALRGCGIVAVGLGGEEAAAPASAFRRAFERARALGLRTVAHAGEGGRSGSVREAIEILGAERIGHGIAAAPDARLMADLARRGTVLEVCPTSNVMTGVVRSAARHPLLRLARAGVQVAIGSDDRTVFGTTLKGEFRAAAALGATRADMERFLLNAAEGSFAPRGIRSDLARRIRSAFHGRPAS